MKRLFLILILTLSFQSIAKADDIRDFQIEGISIGDSLLTFMSVIEIDKALSNASFYKDKKYAVIFSNKKTNEFDENLQVTFNPKDKNYIIESMMVIKDFSENFDECKKEKFKRINEIISIFVNTERADTDGKHMGDKLGDSYDYVSTFYLKGGGYINIKCTDYSEEALKQNGWYDVLTMSVGSQKFKEFMLSGDVY